MQKRESLHAKPRKVGARRDLNATFYIWSKRVRRLEISKMGGLQGQKENGQSKQVGRRRRQHFGH